MKRSIWVFLLAMSSAVRAESPVEYNRDVRPILAENCFACHGPDSASRQADLRIDRRDDAVKFGAIVPGKPNESPLIQRIRATESDKVMPPPRSHKSLKPEQKQVLERWVAQGAEYQPHWSFITPKRPAIPSVKDSGWVKTPIDAFILATLEKQGLKPAPEADRRTLARRLSFDLTGLPPEPALVESFVNDKSPNAYESYVDTLLKSPHWGEHRGRYWLDVARYADTHGIHFDNYREMWSYRDWVVNAFNKNVPFDQFTIEQLAGDLLPNRTLEQQIASGFNRCNITTNEGGAINEEYLVLYNRDRTETTSQVWLGLTAGCAVCHDHKFDPITQKDFYSMAAFFNNTTQNAMDGNIHNTPPIVQVPRVEDREKFVEIAAKLAAAREKLENRKKEARPGFEAWVKDHGPMAGFELTRLPGLKVHAPLDEQQGRATRVAVDGQIRSLKLPAGFEWAGKNKVLTFRAGTDAPELPDAGDFDRNQPFSISLSLNTGKRGQNGAILGRMDKSEAYRGWDIWVENDRIGLHFIHHWPDNAVKILGRTAIQPRDTPHVTITHDGSGKAAGFRMYINGQQEAFDVVQDSLKDTTRTKVPFKIGQRNAGERAVGASVGDLRIYDRAVTQAEARTLAKAPRLVELIAKDTRTPQETTELYDWWLGQFDEPSQKLTKAVSDVQAEETQIIGRGTIAHVMAEKSGDAMAFVLNRGEYDQRRDPVKPATPPVLPPFPESLPKTRLGFARWLLLPEHPLTTRVTVNRFWQELFGVGIVRSAGDFGISGELPSHGELLDWLAIEFREKGWDVKQLFKMLVMSSTYRQSSQVTSEKLAKDPENRLLSRGARFRMDAEMIRDNALSVSGLLVPKIGGPSVKPYQPDGVWEAVAMIGSNTRDYKRDKGENLYRRSLYTFWKRAAPPATMEVFNAPNRETCTVRRERTNTPLQALVTLNDVQFVEAARNLAERTVKAAKEPRERLDFMARRLVSRPLTEAELGVIQLSLDQLIAHYRNQPDEAAKLIAVGESKADSSLDAVELAAWTMLANELMNLDEVLNK